MDNEAAIALFDQLEADGEPLDDWSEFDDLGSSHKDRLSSGQEELFNNDLFGGGDPSLCPLLGQEESAAAMCHFIPHVPGPPARHFS